VVCFVVVWSLWSAEVSLGSAGLLRSLLRCGRRCVGGWSLCGLLACGVECRLLVCQRDHGGGVLVSLVGFGEIVFVALVLDSRWCVPA